MAYGNSDINIGPDSNCRVKRQITKPGVKAMTHGFPGGLEYDDKEKTAIE